MPPAPRGQPPNPQKQPAKARRKRAASQATLKCAACSFVYWGFHGFCLEIPQRYYRTAFFHLERTINGRGRVIKSVIDVLAYSFHVLLELLARHYRTFKNEFQFFANVGQTHSVLGKSRFSHQYTCNIGALFSFIFAVVLVIHRHIN